MKPAPCAPDVAAVLCGAAGTGLSARARAPSRTGRRNSITIAARLARAALAAPAGSAQQAALD
jgi:hypothetical protein